MNGGPEDAFSRIYVGTADCFDWAEIIARPIEANIDCGDCGDEA